MRLATLFLIPLFALAQAPKKAAVAGDDRSGYTDTPQIPGQKWKVHDAARPRPPKVMPGRPTVSTPAPADADVLFDGKDLSKWQLRGRKGDTAPANWKVQDGYVEVVSPEGGRWNMVTKASYGDMQLHIEWLVPKEDVGQGQAGGNSGVEIMGLYEVQVMESFENLTYADGQAASLYGQWPPTVNASTPKGEWNAYDIFFTAPRFEGDKLVKPAYVTVVHNGVLVQNHREMTGPVAHRRVVPYTAHGELPLSLQDHGHPVRYRNIWVRRLKDGQ